MSYRGGMPAPSRPLLVALAAAALLLAVGGASAAAGDKHFQTPSHKIQCLYTTSGGAFLRCDVLWLNDTGFRLTKSGKGRKIHVTDSVVDTKAHVLHYGKTLKLGPFSCASRKTGLTCKTRANGHGFRLSRSKQKAF